MDKKRCICQSWELPDISNIPCGTYNPNNREVKVIVPIIPPKYSANGFFPSVSKIAERAANISKTINHK